MTNPGFGRLLLMLQGLWPSDQALTDFEQELWRNELDRFTDEQAVSAVKALSHDGRARRPVVGEIYRKALDLSDDTPSWGHAWQELRSQASYPVAHSHWSHSVVQEAARQIGLEEIGNSTRGDTAFEAQCRRVYEDIRDDYRAGKRYEDISNGMTHLPPAGLDKLAEHMTP
jgi:hypothetical protein